jgi:biotin carboxyl carrier protein
MGIKYHIYYDNPEKQKTIFLQSAEDPTQLSAGTKFSVSLQEPQGVIKYDVTVIGDGRSLLIGSDIYRFSRAKVIHSQDTLLLPFLSCQQGVWRGVIAPHVFSATQIRPITPKKQEQKTSSFIVKSPLTGKILKILHKEGEHIQKGDVVFTVEAMKMENQIIAAQNGILSKILVTVGQNVNANDVLTSILGQE